jgi:hypothetical protein
MVQENGQQVTIGSTKQRKNMTKSVYINNIELDMLHDLFVFDLENGKVFWKNPPKNHPKLLNQEAGHKLKTHSKKIYWKIKINSKNVFRSHIIFYVANGYRAFPCIDHINGNSLDDRPCNLRQATETENSWNHRTRKKTNDLPMGIRQQNKKFVARISHNNKPIYLGTFANLEDAVNIYKQKRIELYGQFSGY